MSKDNVPGSQSQKDPWVQTDFLKLQNIPQEVIHISSTGYVVLKAQCDTVIH